jgi:hypothetical protein
MNTYEDDEFERIAMEQRIREETERLEISQVPFITAEEWKALNETD